MTSTLRAQPAVQPDMSENALYSVAVWTVCGAGYTYRDPIVCGFGT